MDYPRVTEILKPFTGYEYVPGEILKKAAARGTTVHALCAGIAKGAWIPDGMIDPEYLGYVDSFRKWAKDNVREFIIIEKRYQDDNLEFTGQVDFVIKANDGQTYLVDLKTSARPQKTYSLQMAAYTHLLFKNEIPVNGAILVYLSKDGEQALVNTLIDLSKELRIFMSALECYKYFHPRKKNARSEA